MSTLYLPFEIAEEGPPVLPPKDAVKGAIEQLLIANKYYRGNPWPKPYDITYHQIYKADARKLQGIADASVHLIVTSPPYWTLKSYENSDRQLGNIEDYELFLHELDKVWSECFRVLVEGGRLCCVVGDVCLSRKVAGRHHVMPLHADIAVRARKIGYDYLTPIMWSKIANGVTEAKGNGAGFYGKPYQPGAIVKNDTETILLLRKSGAYRSPSQLQSALSMLTREEMKAWLRTCWHDVRGQSTKDGHPAPYPVPIAERLIRMFSFAGDTILDPFAGTATTSIAAVATGRNSICIDIEEKYVELGRKRLAEEIRDYSALRTSNAVLVLS